MIGWPVVWAVMVSAGVLLVVGLFYHGGRRAGVGEVLVVIDGYLKGCDLSHHQEYVLRTLRKGLADEYDLD